MQDTKLFTGLKTGNREAVRQIYDSMLPKVISWVVANNGSQSDAEDVFQEALEIILLKIEKLNHSLSGLIMQLAKRRWIDKLRKNSKQWSTDLSVIDQASDTSLLDELVEKELEYNRYKIMDLTFRNLSATCQKLLELLKSGKSVDELVKLMDFSSANTLYRRKSACTNRWSELIKQNAEYETYFV